MWAMDQAAGRLAAVEHELREQRMISVTWRRLVEVERERYRELFDFVDSGLLVTSPRAEIREANPAATSLLGGGKDGLKGRNLLDLATPEATRALLDVVGACQLGEDGDARDIELILDSRVRRRVHVRARPCRDLRDRVIGIRWQLREVARSPAPSGRSGPIPAGREAAD